MKYDLIIIGAGPAGYVAAIRAGQVGLKTVLVEAESIGGMCLNWGCIPTKSLMESAKKFEMVKKASTFGIEGINIDNLELNWEKVVIRSQGIVERLTKGVEYLLKKNGVQIVRGNAEIISQNSVQVGEDIFKAWNIIIATGSVPKKINLPVPENLIIEVKDLLAQKELPEYPVVLGCNPHAVELVQFFKLIGKNPKLVMLKDKLLPGLDEYLAAHMERMLKKQNIEIFKTEAIKGYESGRLLLENDTVACNTVINATLREPVIPKSKINFNREDGFLKVNDNLQTNYENIYAVGDVNGISKYAHAASAQGLHTVNHIKGIEEDIQLQNYPVNIYTYPEMAQIGYTERTLSLTGISYKVTEFPLSANGKALIEGQTEGVIRLLSEEKYGQVLGVQIIAENATDMIAEASVLMELEGTIYDLARTVHAHPTISEVFMESGFAAFDQSIHK